MTLVTLMTLGCNRADTPRARELRPRPVTPSGRTHINEPAKLSSIESGRTDALGRPMRVACVTCHSLRTPKQLPKSVAELDEFHRGLTFRHADSLTCASCHVVGKQNSLRMADGHTIPMADVMTLCGQCHGPQLRDYRRGAHGGVNGSWNAATGDRSRNNCVDCHDPHVPAYQPGRPVLVPRDRGLVASQGAAHE